MSNLKDVINKFTIMEDKPSKIIVDSGFAGQFILTLATALSDGLMSKEDYVLLRDVQEILLNILTGGYRELITDNETTNVNVTLDIGKEITFLKNLSELNIVFPNDVSHGYVAALNFKTNGDEFPINITNDSSFDMKIMRYNQELEHLQVSPNKKINLIAYCDGFYLYVYYKEV